MPTPTLFMGLPNPNPFGDNLTWAGEIVTCNIGFDTLAVAAVPTVVTSTGSLPVYNGLGLIEVNATSGAVVLTLPDATIAANKGRRYSIVKVDSSGNTVTVQGFSGGQTISGQTTVVLSTQWTILNITSDGTAWINADPETVFATPFSVSVGGTGVSTLTLNGVLFGNGTSPVQVTAQGAANTVLVANAGAPSFSTTPTVTSITTTGGTTTLAGTVTISGTATYTAFNPVFFLAQGNGTKVQLSTGTTTTGDVVTYDVNGNTVDSGTLLTSLAPLASPTFTGTVGLPIATLTGKITNYNSIVTAGNGVVSIYGATSQKVESAADPSVLSFTPPAAVGTYRVRFVLSVSAAASAVLGWTITYTDSNGNPQTPTNLVLNQVGVFPGALTFNTSSPGNYNGAVDIDIDASATPIVVQFTLASGTITAKASSTIERII